VTVNNDDADNNNHDNDGDDDDDDRKEVRVSPMILRPPQLGLMMLTMIDEHEALVE
jgi:hypothetical protein